MHVGNNATESNGSSQTCTVVYETRMQDKAGQTKAHMTAEGVCINLWIEIKLLLYMYMYKKHLQIRGIVIFSVECERVRKVLVKHQIF